MTTMCGFPLVDDDALFDCIAADRDRLAGGPGAVNADNGVRHGLLHTEEDLWEWLAIFDGRERWPHCLCMARSTCCNDHVLVRHSDGRLAVQERHHETGAPVTA